eukprot:COSAG02_NODE_526_length_20707_cov_11.431337_17_plen_50_part_00
MPKLYTWEQTQSEVRVFVPVPQDFNFKRDVKYLLSILVATALQHDPVDG